jgi:hypothetical protein
MHWILGSFGPLRTASGKAVCAFHSKIGRVFRVGAGFFKLVLEVRRKYQMLWFAVDLHHRQRYFFIYGCERTVKKTQRKGSQSNPFEGRDISAYLSLAPFPVRCQGIPPNQGLCTGGGRVFIRILLTERIF